MINPSSLIVVLIYIKDLNNLYFPQIDLLQIPAIKQMSIPHNIKSRHSKLKTNTYLVPCFEYKIAVYESVITYR